jgi:hypothetical protein
MIYRLEVDDIIDPFQMILGTVLHVAPVHDVDQFV